GLQDTVGKLHGRYYNMSSRRPVLKAIHTQMNSTGRAPRLDIVFAQHKIQPYIHDAIVSVVHRNATTHFHIFVKNHCQLRPNKIIQRWSPARTWRGDILVMRKGVSHDLVNLHGGDGALADFAVKK
ncbi:hypothetical protein BD779DRAFT_1451188, partial [Infundibulicybe gibba]